MLSESVELDIVVHEVPNFIGVAIGLDMMEKMVNEIKNLKYLKLELPKPGPDISIYTQRFGKKFPLIWGMAGMFTIEAYKRGAIGIIGSPETTKVIYDIHNYLEDGSESNARGLLNKWFQFFAFTMTTGNHAQATAKKVLYWKSIIKSDKLREPCQPLDKIHEEELKQILHDAGEDI
jgi:dihydrodipicolinate synthase/N-acetylneuraminate lyase